MRLMVPLVLLLVPQLALSQTLVSESPLEFLKEAERLAKDGRWKEAFGQVDAAVDKAHKDLGVHLEGMQTQKVDALEHEVVKYLAEHYSPVFFYGISLALRAPQGDESFQRARAKHATYWALNVKSVARDIVGKYLSNRKLVPPPLAKPADVQAKLSENSALAVFVRYENFANLEAFPKGDGTELYAGSLVLPSNGVYFAPVGTDKEIDDLVAKIYGTLNTFERKKTNLSKFDEQMEELGRKLLGGFPQAAGLHSAKRRWLLSPTADIWLVPFPALPIGKDRYAIQEHAISYEISGRDIITDDFKPRPGNRTLIMGRPDFDALLQVPENRRSKAAIWRAPPVKDFPTVRRGGDVGVDGVAWEETGPDTSSLGRLEQLRALSLVDADGVSAGFKRACRQRRWCPPMYWPPCLPQPHRFLPPPEPPNDKERASLLGGELEYSYEPLQGDIELLPRHIAEAVEAPNIPDPKTIPWLDENAREDLFITSFSPGAKEHYDIVVLITHGFFLPLPTNENTASFVYTPPDPLMRCGIVLSGYNKRASRGKVPELILPGKNDGILTAHEVAEECRFAWDGPGGTGRTDLVALISCLGGRADRDGDSLASLRYAFTRAGARLVLAASWTVEPNSAAEVARTFFKERRGGADNVTALQKAQEDYLEKHRGTERHHPYYWATFSLTH